MPFFKTLVLNSMMSLTKCNFQLTEYMKQNPEFGSFWQIIRDEYDRTIRLLLEISGFDVLMEEEEKSRMSVSIRERIVLPLLIIQQYALQQLAKNPENKEVLEKLVTRTLYGNINASRNAV